LKAAGDATADDFLAREKAMLGDDADQFATGHEGAAFKDGDDDLLGGGNSGAQDSAFESQFPDISGTNEVMRAGHSMQVSLLRD
jgi:hypothetical protein